MHGRKHERPDGTQRASFRGRRKAHEDRAEHKEDQHD